MGYIRSSRLEVYGRFLNTDRMIGLVDVVDLPYVDVDGSCKKEFWDPAKGC